MGRRLVALLAAGLVAGAGLAGGCGQASAGDADGAEAGRGGSAEIGEVMLADAWIRPTPPISNVGAFYLRIENRGSTPDRVIGASAPRCAEIEIHRTEVADGVASMARAEPDHLEIAAGGELGFEPTGLHIMCLGLDQPVEEGARVTLTIEFERAGPVTVEAEAGDR